MQTGLQDSPTDAARAAQAMPSAGGLTWRSIALGLLGVALICTFAPYNDYVLNNTYLVGNFLPLGLLIAFLTLVLAVNAPLYRWCPRKALRPGELAVTLAMLLVGCAVPTSGLLRYLPSHLVGIPHLADSNPDHRLLLQKLDLPGWMFPADDPATPVAERGSTPVVQDYVGHAQAEDETFLARWRAVPWRAWMRPALGWGVLVALIYGAVLAMSLVVQRQWAENERLPFPLATIYVSLLEAPQPGQLVNDLFRSRPFWVAALAVFGIHLINGLSRYYPGACPSIPLGFDLRAVMADPPWSYAEWPLKVATLYFSMVGIAFYMQTKTAFSLWAFYWLLNLAKMSYESRQLTLSGAMSTDQLYGAVVAYAGAAVWIGRRHWINVLNGMIGRRAISTDSIAAWCMVVCLIGVGGWLCVAGASVAGAVVITLSLLVFFFVAARVVAETGLVFMQLDSRLVRPWVILANSLPEGWRVRTTTRSYFFTALFYSLFTRDMRESLAVFATQANRVRTLVDGPADGRRALAGFMASLFLAAVAAYCVGGASTLYTEYSFGVTADRTQRAPLNDEALVDVVQSETLDGAAAYLPPRAGPVEVHNRLGHLTFGAGLTAALWAATLRWSAWPLHPVGYLLAFSNPIQQIWFSVFVGWLIKVVVVRLGGVDLLRQFRLVAVGLVVGEATAAAVWLVVAVVRHAAHMEYLPIRLLPG